MGLINGALQNILIVDRKRFMVKHYKRGRLQGRYSLKKTYNCAVGAVGYATPAGMYYVQGKALNPDWLMPNSDWVPEELRGEVIPGGDPRNPLKGAFLALHDGIGLHGTDNMGSMGTRASHGCIRLSEPEVLELYERIPVDTPVYIF